MSLLQSFVLQPCGGTESILRFHSGYVVIQCIGMLSEWYLQLLSECITPVVALQDMAEFNSLIKKGDKSGKGRLLKAKFSVCSLLLVINAVLFLRSCN
jgi:hypothetical protein